MRFLPIPIAATMTNALRLRPLLLSVLIVLAAGIVYEAIGELNDKRLAPAGRLVAVKGHNMHIFAKGSGGPTVVFVSGWKVPSPYVDFYPLWSDISKHARVVDAWKNQLGRGTGRATAGRSS